MSRIEIGGRSITTGEIQDLLETDHPMVARFRFERARGGKGDELGFALHIVSKAGVRYQQQRDSRGRRVPPVWKTLTGGEIIGQGNRIIWQEGEELVAENSTFFPRQEYNDLGIGSALYVSMERLYRHLGISRVTLLAVDVGVYVWARQGFAYAESGRAAGLVRDLEQYINDHGASVSLEPSRFAQSWDLASYDLPGVTVDGDRLGKAYMLHRAPPWHGVKYLDDEHHNRVAEASRQETFARLPQKIEGAPAMLAVR